MLFDSSRLDLLGGLGIFSSFVLFWVALVRLAVRSRDWYDRQPGPHQLARRIGPRTAVSQSVSQTVRQTSSPKGTPKASGVFSRISQGNRSRHRQTVQSARASSLATPPVAHLQAATARGSASFSLVCSLLFFLIFLCGPDQCLLCSRVAAVVTLV